MAITADSVVLKYQSILDKANNTTGKNDTDLTSAANSLIDGYEELNIAFCDEAPEDVTKLWVDSETPNNIIISSILRNESHRTVNVLDTVLQTGCWGMASAVVGNKVYLFGGDTNDRQKTIMMFDTNTELLTTLDITLPKSTRDMTSAVVGNKVYLFGGLNQNNILVFDTDTNTLTTLDTTLPSYMSCMNSAVVGNKVYLFGGESATTSSGSRVNVDTIMIFDVDTSTLTTLDTTLPSCISGMASAAVGNKVYLFGGFYGSCLNTIMAFDTDTNTITTLDIILPVDAYSMTSAVVGNKVYLFGGIGSANLSSIMRCTIGLPYDAIQIQPSIDNNLCTILKGNTLVELGIESVYIGGVDGTPLRLNAYLHNGAEWNLI